MYIGLYSPELSRTIFNDADEKWLQNMDLTKQFAITCKGNIYTDSLWSVL